MNALRISPIFPVDRSPEALPRGDNSKANIGHTWSHPQQPSGAIPQPDHPGCRLPGKPVEIGIFRALQLGDLLCAIPALRALRMARPQARITLIGLPWARDLIRRTGYIDDFIEFPGFPGLPERSPDLPSLGAFIAAARARQFDLLIQMHGSGTITNPLVGMLGARRTAGFYLPGEHCPDDETYLPWPEHLPEIRRLLALMRHLNIPACGEMLELPILPEERMQFLQLRATLPIGPKGYVCVHPGARMASRRWPVERFAQVADQLAAAGLTIVLTGTHAEAPLLQAIREQMQVPAIDLAGRTSLGALAALVMEAELVICNDTGMSHVAAAVGTRSVVICSGADPLRWRPLDDINHRFLWHPVACRPCAWETCPTGHECAKGVAVQTVVQAGFSLLDAP
jgi:ADP-heptose:LPS heptosyltransferase